MPGMFGACKAFHGIIEAGGTDTYSSITRDPPPLSASSVAAAALAAYGAGLAGDAHPLARCALG